MTRGVHSSLRVPANLEAVGFVRSALACLLTRERWWGEGAGRVLLASTEALTNAIEHGSPLGGSIDVDVSVAEGLVRIRVADEGRPGAPLPSIPSAPPPPASTRGRGLLIIGRLADEVEITRSGAGTAIVVTFLPPAMQAARAA